MEMSNTAEILYEAILSCTAGHGMGLIKLMLEASDYTKLPYLDLKNWLWDSRASYSWKKLDEVVEKYMKNDDCRTFLWARLFDDRYFCDYASKHHPYLSGIFAGIISCHKGDGIKNAVWFKNNTTLAEQGYDRGRKLCLQLQKRREKSKRY